LKDAYYFSHDSNARHDPKLGAVRSKYGWAGYGIYWAIIECLRDQTNYSYPNSLLYGLALAIGFDLNDDINFDEFIAFLIKVDLLKDNGTSIYSQSLLNRMNALTEYRHKLSEAGKEGAKKRWGGYSLANSLACDPNSSKVKESKVKESKDSNTRLTARLSSKEFLDSLKDNPAYKGIDLERESAKMDVWLIGHPGRKKTKRFVVNWLNKVEVPLESHTPRDRRYQGSPT